MINLAKIAKIKRWRNKGGLQYLSNHLSLAVKINIVGSPGRVFSYSEENDNELRCKYAAN